MSAEKIGEVLRAHQPTTGMQVASGMTCRCGYWNGNERAGIDRPVGCQGLTWHQAKELEAAGYALAAIEQEVWECYLKDAEKLDHLPHGITVTIPGHSDVLTMDRESLADPFFEVSNRGWLRPNNVFPFYEVQWVYVKGGGAGECTETK